MWEDVKMKIETINNKCSFKELQEQITLVANSISRMENENIKKEDVEGWTTSLDLRIRSMNSLMELASDYLGNVSRKNK